MKAITTFVVAAIGGAILDIVSKWIVFSQIDEFDKITLIPGLINLLHSKNEGVVFGMFPGKTNFFIIFSIIAIAVIIYIYLKSDKTPFASNLALGLVLAGAMGNLWDRIRYGYVRDFIDLHLGSKYHWPTFNIADSLICIGIACMVFTSISVSKTRTVH
ncbi:MAG: signal peptidase II [Candidatus Brocadia sp.]|jgi:lipoprotein signal peptidase|uniref:Lipoprotein signal peptidase n=1 Tax=Candidatus Brocadia fulgida TaxID=380242 RepID=A0A0M2UYF9_9BACT|nr:MAG: type II lipoprotein signal peptidase [Candidatus Brocadia fulgida]MCC6326151.1 signal peptidase II [Candidatus Brocadia sp.]MCE7912568.1 signal peptidase II [Candidatus Brocadia sp. AMX3]OQZ00801.1 MAG: signal peptidase II [Candidatus Brocadia sp. UTAMX2]MDG5997984.1 signal peptidase II [Candidatus Brocadia sp.]